ncbi:MAG: FkbM family methyltransferase [Fimbriimonadales bacterium]|nr:FkbM family methyltransferase [Fimbriimonadales bacterium]
MVQLDNEMLMKVHLDDIVGFTIWLKGWYQKELVDAVRQYLRDGMTFVDIGAHFGQFTLAASSIVGSTGRVLAFEPASHQRKYLIHNVKLNNLSNIFVSAEAVWKSSGSVSFIEESPNQAVISRISDEGQSKIDATTIDRIASDQHIPQLDVIKIDAEGSERAIFEGATHLLSTNPPRVILYERGNLDSSDDEAVQELLHQKGFRLFSPHRMGLRPFNPTSAMHVTDLVAVHKSNQNFENL